MMTRRLASSGTALRVRDRLESELETAADTVAVEWLTEVLDQAIGALSADVLVAAAGRDPFAFTNVMAAWRGAIARLSELRGEDPNIAAIVIELTDSNLPSLAFADVSAILRQAREEDWTTYRTRRHLSALLLPRQGTAQRSTYRARVRGLARTAATRTAGARAIVELEAAGYGSKRWVARLDEATRDSHAAADGQTVPLNSRFTVGGHAMMAPGDPTAPYEEIVNCRCVIVGADPPPPPPPARRGRATRGPSGGAMRKTPGPSAVRAAGEPSSTRYAGWSGILGIEGQLTGDGRMLALDSMDWSDTLPAPLRYAPSDTGGHDGAVDVGAITKLERRKNGQTCELLAEGYLDMQSMYAYAALEALRGGVSNGVSMDLDSTAFEVHVARELVDEQDAMMRSLFEDTPEETPADGEDGQAGPARELAPDGEHYIVAKISPDDEIMVTTSARVRAATLVSIPAFQQARLSLDDSVEVPSDPAEEEAPALAAAGGPLAPPREWFADPQLTEVTPLRVTEDGRIVGHLAAWGTHHTSFPGQAVTPPRSPSGYAYFHTGALVTADGTEIAVGHVTMDTGHAAIEGLSANGVIRHYDHTGTVAADVRAGEDAFGIWVSGALRPGLSDERVRALRSAPLSGDWRTIGAGLELVAALAVNSPGFPIPRPAGMVAAAGPRQHQGLVALVAAGLVPPSRVVRPGRPGALSEDDLRYLRGLLDRERAADTRRRRAGALALRARAARARLALRRR